MNNHLITSLDNFIVNLNDTISAIVTSVFIAYIICKFLRTLFDQFSQSEEEE